jgi:hypothetical protein
MKGDYNYFESISPRLDTGRYWCIKCQHGADANEEGYCVECKTVNRDVLLVKIEKEEEKAEKEVVTISDNVITTSVEVPKVVKKKKSKKDVGGQVLG